jgi:hypothetical protein
MTGETTFSWSVGRLPPKVALTAPCWLHPEDEEPSSETAAGTVSWSRTTPAPKSGDPDDQAD